VAVGVIFFYYCHFVKCALLVRASMERRLTMERDFKDDKSVDDAYRIFCALCAQYPDRLITLVDARGRTLARSKGIGQG
jgi:hypothetical protein